MRPVRWVFDCLSWKPTHSELMTVLSSIQPEEKERIAKFVFMKDAICSLIGRLLMRKFICETSGTPWEEISISRDTNGKPYFVSAGLPVSFNVSHHGRYVVLAGEEGLYPVGVDVMEMNYKGGKSTAEFFRFMNRNFDPQEWLIINEPKADRDKLQRFFRYWCLKESYVKAVGTGITVDLRSIVFKLNTKELRLGSIVSDTLLFVSGVEQKQWLFQESLVDKDYCCSVALLCGGGNIGCQSQESSFKPILFDDIISCCKRVIPVDPDYCSVFLTKE